MHQPNFDELNLIEPLHRALRAQNYTVPTPIQDLAIPHPAGRPRPDGQRPDRQRQDRGLRPAHAAEAGRRPPAPRPRTVRSLVLAPTRELAAQIYESFGDYGRFLGIKKAVVYGGVGKKPQIDAIAPGIDVLVATPGRLLDLYGERRVRLDAVEIFVLDEADRMLDMGFIPDVRRIIALLPKQAADPVLLGHPACRKCSAWPRACSPTRSTWRWRPRPGARPRIEQRVLFVDKESKTPLLLGLLEDPAIERALVFTRTKHRANRLAEQLQKGRIKADAIHGNKTQSARERALEEFISGKIRVLVATDIAARGIDVDDISHVINFELPNEPESYVHRIGRTARAGKAGVAISFCDESESGYLRDIERLLDQSVPVSRNHPFHSASAAAPRGRWCSPRPAAGARPPEACCTEAPEIGATPAGSAGRSRVTKKILLVHPQFPATYWSFKYALPFIGKKAALPPLGLLTVAAMLPARLRGAPGGPERQPRWRWRTCCGPTWCSLSAMIVQKDSFEQVTALCKEYGKPVVAGGPYPITMYDQIQGVDHFVLDEAELTLPRFLRDFEEGRPQRVYRDPDKPDLTPTPAPRFDLIDVAAYDTMPLQYSRGCPFACEFCDIIEMFGRVPRTKTPEQFLRELDALYWPRASAARVFIVDDNFIGNRRKVRELLPAVAAWQQEHGLPLPAVHRGHHRPRPGRRAAGPDGGGGLRHGLRRASRPRTRPLWPSPRRPRT